MPLIVKICTTNNPLNFLIPFDPSKRNAFTEFIKEVKNKTKLGEALTSFYNKEEDTVMFIDDGLTFWLINKIRNDVVAEVKLVALCEDNSYDTLSNKSEEHLKIVLSSQKKTDLERVLHSLALISKSTKITPLDLAIAISNAKIYERIQIFSQAFIVRNHPNCDLKKIEIKRKQGGVQVGFLMDVPDDNDITKYHIKTHQDGYSQENEQSKLVDPRELMIYKWLEFMGLGANVFFFHNDYNASELFIASLDLGTQFKTFDQLDSDSFKAKFKENPNYQRGLVLADLVSKIFYLTDVANNSSNFGFVQDELKIVDFKINNTMLGIDMISLFNQNDISPFNRYGTGEYFSIDVKKKLMIGEELFDETKISHTLDQAAKFALQYVTNVKYKYNSQLKSNLELRMTAFQDFMTLVQQNIRKVKDLFQ